MFWEEEKKFYDDKDIAFESCVELDNWRGLLKLPYTFQELLGGNLRLIEYFSRDDVLTNLANTALRPEINESNPIKDRYKLSNACTEILTVRNVNEITEAFLNCEDALDAVRLFFHDNPSNNHLVCGFFARIVQHMFHESLNQALKFFSSYDFVSDCVANMRMCAISELMQNIVWISEAPDDFLTMKQWYVSQDLCNKVVDLLVPSQPECVHENVMELYCSLVRNTRDHMYALETTTDVLNDELQSEKLVRKLFDKMLERNDNGAVCSSVTRNACEILICLLSSNHILFRPSHTLYKELNAEIPWVGGNPSGSEGAVNEASKENVAVWCPDADRVVEKVVATRISEVISLVIDDLESETVSMDEKWSYLLRLVVELCDTNYLETHVVLEEQLRKCDVERLFSLVWRHPRSSILHGLLLRIVSFILYSSTDQLSPLITYLFITLELPCLLRFGIQPRCTLPKIDLFSLRTYHIHLVMAVEQARRNSTNSQGLEELLQGCLFWSDVVSDVDEWLSWNLPDPEVLNVRQLNQHAYVDVLDDCERQGLPPHQNELLSFKNESVSLPMTDVFDTALGELQVSSETKGFSVHGIRVSKVEVNLEENDVDESSFEAMCTMRESSLLSDWPMQNGDQPSKIAAFVDNWPGSQKWNGESTDDWPGVSRERQREASTRFHVQWDREEARNNSEGLNDWPCPPQNSSTPKHDLVEDEWADFSSLRTENCLASDWPSEDQESSASPNASEAVIDDPVSTGFAAAVANSLLEEHATSESEC